MLAQFSSGIIPRKPPETILPAPTMSYPPWVQPDFSSALGVETFLKKSSLIAYSKEALLADADHIQALANLEGLSAHANSVAIRVATLK